MYSLGVQHNGECMMGLHVYELIVNLGGRTILSRRAENQKQPRGHITMCPHVGMCVR